MAVPGRAYEAAYTKTPVGVVEVKEIPAAQLMVTEAGGSYFDRGNELFRRLFRYLSANEVAMTVPVEAETETARMKFYIGSADSARQLTDQGEVRIVSVPSRTVISIGLRGSYTRARYENGRAKLLEWQKDHPEYATAGEAYAVYWDAPFTLWFLKRSEVHLPVAAGPPAAHDDT